MYLAISLAEAIKERELEEGCNTLKITFTRFVNLMLKSLNGNCCNDAKNNAFDRIKLHLATDDKEINIEGIA